MDDYRAGKYSPSGSLHRNLDIVRASVAKKIKLYISWCSERVGRSETPTWRILLKPLSH